mmetsp:Transcript_25972/g.78230  ORF Transcript_25972/g.78230 Transcript_25972/m.78230 type:complete len:325 (+) Transcript_25972:1054-2028(+)
MALLLLDAEQRAFVGEVVAHQAATTAQTAPQLLRAQLIELGLQVECLEQVHPIDRRHHQQRRHRARAREAAAPQADPEKRLLGHPHAVREGRQGLVGIRTAQNRDLAFQDQVRGHGWIALLEHDDLGGVQLLANELRQLRHHTIVPRGHAHDEPQAAQLGDPHLLANAAAQLFGEAAVHDRVEVELQAPSLPCVSEIAQDLQLQFGAHSVLAHVLKRTLGLDRVLRVVLSIHHRLEHDVGEAVSHQEHAFGEDEKLERPSARGRGRSRAAEDHQRIRPPKALVVPVTTLIHVLSRTPFVLQGGPDAPIDVRVQGQDRKDLKRLG